MYLDSRYCVEVYSLASILGVLTRTVTVAPAGERCPLEKQVSDAASYVITGGTGGIGLELASRLAKAGAGGLVLLSRYRCFLAISQLFSCF